MSIYGFGSSPQSARPCRRLCKAGFHSHYRNSGLGRLFLAADYLADDREPCRCYYAFSFLLALLIGWLLRGHENWLVTAPFKPD